MGGYGDPAGTPPSRSVPERRRRWRIVGRDRDRQVRCSNDEARERKLVGLKPVRDLLALLLGIIDQEIERLGAIEEGSVTTLPGIVEPRAPAFRPRETTRSAKLSDLPEAAHCLREAA
jgi:hypothetical protein